MFNGSVPKPEAILRHAIKYYNVCDDLHDILSYGADGTSVAQSPRRINNFFPPVHRCAMVRGNISSIHERGKTMLRKFGKGLCTLVFSSAVVLFASPLAIAAEALPTGGESYTKVLFAVGAMIAAGFAIGVGAVGAGLGIGTAASGACSAVGRNPGVQGKIMMTMLVGMAMAESIAIYALVVSLVLLFANPYMKYFLAG
jgi:F-type H+-transporting ATPase subunit c